MGTSPVKMMEYLDFEGLRREVLKGSRLTKVEWADPGICVMLQGLVLKIYRDGKWQNWIISEGDLLGEDWYVC
jgi:hypothetical protein